MGSVGSLITDNPGPHYLQFSSNLISFGYEFFRDKKNELIEEKKKS